MKNKQTLELPEFLPIDANNSTIKDFVKKRQQTEDHLELLGQQAFCLNLMAFFTEFTDVHELRFSFRNFLNQIFINGDEPEDYGQAVLKYFKDTLKELDKSKFNTFNGGRGLIVKKDNIQAACEEWMGEERYQRWKSLDMEDKLREHTKPIDESKQKRQKI